LAFVNVVINLVNVHLANVVVKRAIVELPLPSVHPPKDANQTMEFVSVVVNLVNVLRVNVVVKRATVEQHLHSVL